VFDPLSGREGLAALQKTTNEVKVHVQLSAGSSIILRVFDDRDLSGKRWDYWQTNGEPSEISGQWDVKFIEGGPTLPTAFTTTNLASWTQLGDTNTQSFAGTAVYSTTFDAPAGIKGMCFLDLGRVCQSARVRLNGENLGVLITPPFRVAVDHLKLKGNKLEIEVTSVAANRVRDLDRRGVNWKYFGDIDVVNLNYRPFDASDWALTDCGLMGPVTVTQVGETK
jgi:hypothetical protein